MKIKLIIVAAIFAAFFTSSNASEGINESPVESVNIFNSDGSIPSSRNVSIKSRLRLNNYNTGKIIVQFNALSNSLLLSGGGDDKNNLIIGDNDFNFDFNATSDLLLNGVAGSPRQAIVSGGDGVNPQWSTIEAEKTLVLTTAPSGVLGDIYTDDSGALCWHNGTMWLVAAGVGTCI